MSTAEPDLIALRVFDHVDEIAAHVAGLVTALLARKPSATLGLPTGGTPRPIYRRLVGAHRRGKVSFAKATTFNLDEYAGIASDHPASFNTYMRDALFGHVDIDLSRAHVPDGSAADLDEEARRYERLIAAAGGIDLMLLGIGSNGHIAFNEPGAPFGSRSRAVELAESTRAEAQAAFGSESVPTHAITMGVATILEAREIVLVALGDAKRDALAAAIEGPVSIDCPASALRRHRRATIICDRAAAAGLRRAK